MGLFGKKENEEEKKQEETKPEVETKAPESVPPPTPEEIEKEKKLIKMLVTYNPETGDIYVGNVQNLTKPVAEFISYRLYSSYASDAVSYKTVTGILNSLINQKKGQRIFVPGQQ